MRDIYSLYDDAVSIVEESCGYDLIGNVTNLVVNSRAIRRWGCCKCRTFYGEKHYTIEVSDRILDEKVPYESVLSVMVHEVLHATSGAKGHKGLWLKRANQIMRKHPELSITRCTNSNFFGLDDDYREKKRKYACQCEKCGLILTRAVQNNFVKNPGLYIHRGCGGHFKRIYQYQAAIC
ncbi:MAG: hypothetical protein IKF80_08175 [Erysipelotrichaceae bacterium]|nr:hypothetical protein [Erysipelotrichaceae bacterium]